MAGPADADPAIFRRWLDPQPREYTGQPVLVRLVQLPEDCWSCGARSCPIVGAELPGEWAAYPDGWATFGECSEGILATASQELLDAHDVGPIEWRRTKIVPEGYWADTCPYCRATFGNFPLLEGLQDAYMQGVERDELPGFRTELPADAFEPDEDYWAEIARTDGWDEDEPSAAVPESSGQAGNSPPAGVALQNGRNEDESTAPSPEARVGSQRAGESPPRPGTGLRARLRRRLGGS